MQYFGLIWVVIPGRYMKGSFFWSPSNITHDQDITNEYYGIIKQCNETSQPELSNTIKQLATKHSNQTNQPVFQYPTKILINHIFVWNNIVYSIHIYPQEIWKIGLIPLDDIVAACQGTIIERRINDSYVYAKKVTLHPTPFMWFVV